MVEEEQKNGWMDPIVARGREEESEEGGGEKGTRGKKDDDGAVQAQSIDPWGSRDVRRRQA